MNKVRVLFLCTGNSARSQIAEGLLRSLGGDRFEAHSAGTHPRSALHPLAVRTMADQGVDIAAQRPKDLDLYEGQTFDYVITLCDRARERCAALPGAEQVDWSFPDPSASAEKEQAAAFRRTVLELRRRIELLVTASKPALPS